MEKITIWQGLFCLILWLIIVLILKPALKYPYKLLNSNRIWGIMLILLFCLFPYWGGDYFHYKEAWYNIRHGGYSHFEDFYNWIIIDLADYYLVFRLIVWGIALIFLFWAYRRVGVSFDLCLFFFGAFYLPWFSYARASLAMSSILLGLTFLTKPVKKANFFSIIIGVSLIWISIFFHRSAVVGIGAAVASLFVMNINKKYFFLLIIIIPLLAYVASQALDIAATGGFEFQDATTNVKLGRYVQTSEGNTFNSSRGWGARIGDFLNQGAVILMILVYITSVRKGFFHYYTRIEKLISAYCFSIILVAMGFLFTSGYTTAVMYYRTLYYAYPAIAVFLASVKSRNQLKGYYKVIFWMAMMASAYSLMYSTYLSTR